MLMSSPIAFTDSQLPAISAAAQPLAGRSSEEVAAGLRDREIGDRLLQGVIAEAQRKYFLYRCWERAAGASKWR